MSLLLLFGLFWLCIDKELAEMHGGGIVLPRMPLAPPPLLPLPLPSLVLLPVAPVKCRLEKQLAKSTS